MTPRCWLTTLIAVATLFFANALAAAAGAADPAPASISLSWGPLPSGWSVANHVMGSPPSDTPLAGSGSMVMAANSTSMLTFQKGVHLGDKAGPLVARVGLRQLLGLATLADFRASEYGKRFEPELYDDFHETRLMGRKAFVVVSNQPTAVALVYFIEIDAARGLWLHCMFGVYFEGGHTSYFPGEVAELMNALRVGPALQIAVDSTPERPFALSVRIEDGGGSSNVAQTLGAYNNVRLLAHVFDRDFNVLKLDDRFMVDGAWDSRGKHLQPGTTSGTKDPPEAAQKSSLPIAVALNGRHEVSLTLVPSLGDLAKWGRSYAGQGVHLPSIPQPLQVKLDFEVVGSNAQSTDEVIALGSKVVSVDWIGRVVGRRFEEPTILEQNRLGDLGGLLERRSGALADYANPPFNDAKGEHRVLIEKRSDPFYSEIARSGSTPGIPVSAAELIRIGDVIRIDAANMAAYGLRGLGAPRKTRAGCVAVRFEFLDGVQAELIVYEDAGPFAMTVGGDADASGFGAGWHAWSYFVAEYTLGQIRDGLIEVVLKDLVPSVAPGFAVASRLNDALAVFSFVVKQANVQHIKLNSRVLAQLDGSGRLRLTTREGHPVVFSTTTGPAGLPVPAGKTAIFEAAAEPRIIATDAATAALAEQRLAGLDARPVTATARPAPPVSTLPESPATAPRPPAAARPAAGLSVVLDEVDAGSVADWGEIYDPQQFNPRFFREEVRSPFDGSTAIRTRAVGNTVATCETKWIRRVYATGPQDSSHTQLEAYVDFAFDGTTYNLPSLSFELLDAQDHSLGRRTYFGKGVIGQFNRSQLGATGYVELRSATGIHRFDLSRIGANIRFTKVAVYLQNYTCQGENSLMFDHLLLHQQ
jgi:hypothetical protein